MNRQQPRTTLTTTWIARPQPQAIPALRLFAVPHAGSGISAFHGWPEQLPAGIELCAIRLPGREARWRETPYQRLDPLIQELAAAVLPLLHRPFALFGHSMGALVCFELARELRRQRAPAPAALFVAAFNAPHLPNANPPIHAEPDAAFVAAVQRLYNGIPAIIWQNQELMELFLPLLRADFTLMENYLYTPEPPLETPIAALGGEQDNQAGGAALAAWRQHTCSEFRLQLFPGDHFFLHSAREPLLRALSQALTALIDERAGPSPSRDSDHAGRNVG